MPKKTAPGRAAGSATSQAIDAEKRTGGPRNQSSLVTGKGKKGERNERPTKPEEVLGAPSKRLVVAKNTAVDAPSATVKLAEVSAEDTNKPQTVKEATKPKKRPASKAVILDANWKKLKQTLPPSRKAQSTQSAAPTATTPAQLRISTAENDASSKAVGNRKIVALDCEMVGDERRRSMLARVCIVGEKGEVLLDTFVRPTSKVADYRTQYSGVQPHHLTSSKALPFIEAQQRVADIIRGNIVVGHGLKNDFDVLKIDHPKHLTRDTAHYHHFRSTTGQARKLKHLVLERLSYAIQDGRKGHDPVIDAKAALELYKKHSDDWEKMLSRKRSRL